MVGSLFLRISLYFLLGKMRYMRYTVGLSIYFVTRLDVRTVLCVVLTDIFDRYRQSRK